MGRTFQIVKPLIALSALENVMVGAFLRHPRHADARDQAMAVLTRVGLGALAKRRAGELTLSERRRLEVARALVVNPRLLLLDEPLEGLAPIIVEELLRAIRRITREEGLSAIIVEQHPQAILAISDQAVVLDRGTIAHAGTARELREDPALVDRLLGVAR
jgi:ABC-type branched-subunit amino acid transport system ATPase component